MANQIQFQPEAGDRDDYNRSQPQPLDGDPLRELARLIGQTDPNSSFASRELSPQAHAEQRELEPALDQAGPSWMRTAQSSRQQKQTIGGRATPQALPSAEYPHEQLPLSQVPSLIDAVRQQREAVAHQHHHQEPQQLPLPQQNSATRYDDALYGQNPDNIQYQNPPYQQVSDQEYDPNAYQQYAEEVPAPRRRRSGLMNVAAVLALAVVGTASAFAYRSYMGSPRSGEPPVIKAEPGAIKLVPQQSADANKINDRVGATGGPERVVAREEQPVDINARQQPRVVFPPLNPNSNPPSVQSVSTTAPIVASTPQVANGVVGEEPRRVRTTTIRPNETTAASTSPSQTRSPPTAARAQLPVGNAPMAISPQAQTSASAPVRTAAVAATGSTGGYVVQISSQRSEADAQAAFRAMQAKFPNVLGSRSAMIRRADLGERGVYYRAMVGPFSGADDAGQLCNSLKSVGGACVVQRN